MFSCLAQDLKANESRLRDINKVASELESEGLMAEEAPMVQAQVSSLCMGQLFELSSIILVKFMRVMFVSVCSNKRCLEQLLARL